MKITINFLSIPLIMISMLLSYLIVEGKVGEEYWWGVWTLVLINPIFYIISYIIGAIAIIKNQMKK